MLYKASPTHAEAHHSSSPISIVPLFVPEAQARAIGVCLREEEDGEIGRAHV